VLQLFNPGSAGRYGPFHYTNWLSLPQVGS